MDLRKIIKDRMEQLKINVPEMARRIGCNTQTLYNYIAGRTELTASILAQVLDVLAIEVKPKKRPL